MSLRNSATGDLRLRTGLRDLTRRPFVLTFVALGTIELLRVVFDPRPADLVVLALVALVGLLAIRERERVVDAEGSRRTEAESFARILRALSRSVSPDAIVAAIVEELGAGTGADHVAVVRRRPEGRVLEAVLSSTRPGAPTSRTSLPLAELDDPAVDLAMSSLAMAASRGRRLTAVPIEPDPERRPAARPARDVGRPARPVRCAARRGHGGRARAGAHPPGAAARSPAPGVARHARARRRRPADRRPHRRAACADAYGLSNVLAAPLRVDGQTEGAIIVSRRTSEAWPASAHRILEAAASEASAALLRVYSLREAEARASTDALTGLPNRRYFDEYLGLLAKRRRAEDRVGVLMVDIDRFKTLNDTFGHAVGDHVLREVARAIAEAVREDDVPARFGGEEFAVLLRNPSPEIAVEVGERVRRAVASLDLRRLGVPGVSVSVGVAVAESPDVALDVVVDEADQALYRAKREGRDRVVAA